MMHNRGSRFVAHKTSVGRILRFLPAGYASEPASSRYNGRVIADRSHLRLFLRTRGFLSLLVVFASGCCSAEPGDELCEAEKHCGLNGFYQSCTVSRGCGFGSEEFDYFINLRDDTAEQPRGSISCQVPDSCQVQLDQWCAQH